MKSAEAFLEELKQQGGLPDFGLVEKDNFLEPFDGNETAQTALRHQIEARAVSLLALREHGDKELKQKLLKKFPASEAMFAKYQLDESALKVLIFEVVEHCQAQNWQSDERFVEQMVNSLRNKGQGAMKIRQKLQQATSRSDLIDAFLDIDADDWLAQARAALEKKYGNCDKPKERNEQAKRMRFLQSRGFNSDVIWKAFT